MTLMPSTVAPSTSTSTVDPPEASAPPRGKLRAFRYLRSHSGSSSRGSQGGDPPRSSSPPSAGAEGPTSAPNTSHPKTQTSQEQSSYETWLESTLQSAHQPSAASNSQGNSQGNTTSARLESTSQMSQAPADAAAAAGQNLQGLPTDQMPTIRLIPHQDPRSNRPSLSFPPIQRTLPHEDCIIRVGRYSERDANPNPPANTPSSAPIGFKSKVVSRRHCEFWCSQGQWYIKDVKSSSGTFLNHIRLSQPNVESRPWPVNDGDVVQLGIDFRGGEEMIFRCVKIRVECNRAWQKTLNNYNVSTHKRLRDLGRSTSNKKDTDASSSHSSECSICLMSIAPCQSLFVAPCSHVWHYKCIRPILNDHKTWPQFLCPNCRAVTDLEADVEDPNEEWGDEENENSAEPPTHDALQSTTATAEDALDGTHPAAENGTDDLLALAASRSLHVEENHILTPTVTSTSDAAGQSSLLSAGLLDRRGAAPMPSPFLGEDEVTISPTALLSDQLLRPVTPTERHLGDPDHDNSLSRTPTHDQLVSDGPMTPTNNAGPFVFDGSAGRAEGRRRGIDSVNDGPSSL